MDADAIGVREAADRHVRAIVEGCLDDAIAEVVPEGRREIHANLSSLPQPLDGRVEDVRADKDQFVVLLWFKTSAEDEFGVVLESHWAFVEGIPQLHWAYQL